MEAKVKADYRYATVRAFAGREYVKTEWRPVPVGCEEEAQGNELLELRGKFEKPSATEPVVIPAPELKLETSESDATPAAAALAKQNGLDLSTVTGTGADGKITLNDVRAAIGDES